MKMLAVGLVVTVAGASGVTVGVLWERGNKAGQTEDAVAAEVRLLERHRNVPTCDQIRSASAGTGEIKSASAIVLWRLLPGESQIARVVVADDLTVAYETTENPCATKVPATP